ncbi:uncharacterized protein N7459_006948 [Penicillium hispanicum]|uniref:uncharacterized protein n=1 Tax=Penicillium hispanicum TaxID=1080232 RepID=UPI0025418079|nr:uncharacterized protein N7459_006948 [Penicillium hispanicum]KAJ5577984.1 hypothetical protein N7459_006948 [Penicillium hispanicum]
MEPIVHPVFERRTCSWQYVVACPKTKEAVIIDPVLDFEPDLFTVSTDSAEALIDFVAKNGYTVTHLLETHAHADHLSAAYYIQASLWTKGSPHALICIGENITAVQKSFAHKYNIPKEELENAFDQLFKTNERFLIGELEATALFLPGHTPDHVGYQIGANIFTGDTIFKPDIGNARCEFPGGDARKLWRSIRHLLTFPPETRLYAGHDYPTTDECASQGCQPYMTVDDHRKTHKYVQEGAERDFITWRRQRDRALADPRMVHQALQVNVRGGKMPGRSHEGKALFQYLVSVPKTLVSS